MHTQGDQVPPDLRARTAGVRNFSAPQVIKTYAITPYSVSHFQPKLKKEYTRMRSYNPPKKVCPKCSIEWDYGLPVLPALQAITIIKNGNVIGERPRIAFCLCGKWHRVPEPGATQHSRQCCEYYTRTVGRKAECVQHFVDVSNNPDSSFSNDQTILSEYDQIRERYLTRGGCRSCLRAVRLGRTPDLINVTQQSAMVTSTDITPYGGPNL